MSADVFDMIYGISDAMAILYNTQRVCRFGTGESYDVLEKYAEGYSDFWDFMDTFAFNFGLIYDSVLTAIQSV